MRFVKMGNRDRLTSVERDANSRLIINLGNDPSKVGKPGADGISKTVLCQKVSSVQRTGNERAVLCFSEQLSQF